MDNNRNKHRVLHYFVSKPPNERNTLLQVAIAEIKDVPPDKIQVLIWELLRESCLRSATNADQTITTVFITDYGEFIFRTEFFVKASKALFWKNAMNIGLTAANILVALTAVFALLKTSSDNLPELKDRLNHVELELEKIQKKGTQVIPAPVKDNQVIPVLAKDNKAIPAPVKDNQLPVKVKKNSNKPAE